ncbi:MAG: hypothetical protein AB8H80_01970 [Planctomycetota bacterium]
MRGSEVYRQLSQFVDQRRGKAHLVEADAKLRRERLAGLTRERTGTLAELARTRLPELTADQATHAVPEFAAELQEVERDRQERERELLAEQGRLVVGVEQAEQLLAEVTGRLDAIVAKRDGLYELVGQKLQERAGYAELEARARQAEVGLARDVERLEEIDAEAESKLPPYEDSRLFQYLWKRGFGTAEYKARGITRYYDRRLAGYIGYADAVDGYRFLSSVPKLVRLEVDRRQELAEDLLDQVESIEEEVAAEVGLPAVLELGDRCGDEREQAVAELERVGVEAASVQHKLRDEVGSQGHFHGVAIERLAGFFARAEQLSLEQMAAKTPSNVDDELVERLRQHKQELERVAAEIPDLESEAKTERAYVDSLDRMLRRFRSAEFDSGRSRFRGLDLAGVLSRLANESVSPDGAWQEISRRHYFEPPPIVRHRQRTRRTLDGVGIALDVFGAIARHSSRGTSRRGGSIFGGGRSSMGRSSRRSSGGGFGGGGGGFTSGSGF